MLEWSFLFCQNLVKSMNISSHTNISAAQKLKENLDAGCPIEWMLKAIAFSLQEASIQNNLLANTNVNLSRFHSLSPPKISITKYLLTLQKKSKEPKSCFITAFILLDRLLSLQKNITITPNNVHKLCLCSVLIASKFHSDIHLNNSQWAAIGGISVDELNMLELEYLFMLGFSLIVTKEEYQKYEAMFETKAQLSIFH